MTGKKLIWLGCIAVFAALAIVPTGVSAQQQKQDDKAVKSTPDPRIAIVNVEEALRQSLAVKSAREQLNKITAKYKKEIDEEEANLRTMDQELQQQRTILAPEAFAQRREDLQQKAAHLQRKARALRQAMDKGFKDTMQQIQGVLFEEIAKLAKKRHVNIVMPSTQIIVAIEQFDMTAPSIKALNDRLPDVKLTMEEKPAAPESQAAPSR